MVEDERLRTKRKDIDRANEEFHDFSLSSPARKIRRLDVDLPPITEEPEEIDMAMQEETAAEEVEEEEDDDRSSLVNEERAIVLFKPPQYHHSPYGHVFVDSDFISGFKNRFLRDASRRANNDNYDEDKTSENCSQALVCWNPHSHSVGAFQQPRQLEITELDESGEDAVMDDAAMDVEEDNTSTRVSVPQQEEQQHYGLHHWQQQQQQQQQQHCMIPQLPQVSTTPITWFR